MNENALALIENKTGTTLIEAFQPNGLDQLIDKVRERAQNFKADISTKTGRDEIRSFAANIGKDKAQLERIGKSSVEDLQKTVKIVTSERIRAVAALQEIQDEVRKPLTDWEDAEKNRVDYMERMIKHIELCGIGIVGDSPQPLQICLRELEEKIKIAPEEYKEFEARARDAMESSLTRIRTAIEKNNKDAEEKAELERLRKEDADRKQHEHEAKIIAEAAEKARKDAETKAAEDARKETARVLAEKDKVEREKQAAIDLAEKSEKERIASEKKAAQDLIDAENIRIEQANKAERDRVAAIAKAKEAAKIAADKAEEDKLAAIARVHDQVAAEKKLEAAATAKREADKNHRAKINNEALKGISKALSGINADVDADIDSIGKLIIAAIAKGEIQHVRISY